MSLEKVTFGGSVVLFGFLLSFYLVSIYVLDFNIFETMGLFIFCFLIKRLYNLINIYNSKNKLTPIKENEWAIITGCTSGLGKSLAFDMAKEGFNLILISRNINSLKLLESEIIHKYNIRTICIEHDFNDTNIETMKNKLEITKDKYITVLVNNVGISKEITDEYTNYSLSDDFEIIRINIDVQLMMAKLLLPKFKEQKYGYIINISSGSAYEPCPYISVYGSTKAFLRYWSNALSIENEQYNIKFYVCLPLFFLSNMVQEKESILVPKSDVISEAILRHCLVTRESCPYFFHWLQQFIYSNIPLEDFTAKIFTGIYKKKQLEKQSEKKSS